MKDFTSVSVTQYDNGNVQGGEDPVPEEYTLVLHVNDVPFKTFLCTPGHLDCLIVGHLLSEGVIGSADEIKMLSINEQRGMASLWLRDKPLNAPAAVKRARKPADMQAVLDRITEFTGMMSGTHGAAFCTAREMVLYHEDICCLNAADKLIGDAALQKKDTSGLILLTSGRVSSEFMYKALACRAAAAASSGVPTAQAVHLAREYGMVLIGRAAGRGCSLYSS